MSSCVACDAANAACAKRALAAARRGSPSPPSNRASSPASGSAAHASAETCRRPQSGRTRPGEDTAPQPKSARSCARRSCACVVMRRRDSTVSVATTCVGPSRAAASRRRAVSVLLSSAQARRAFGPLEPFGPCSNVSTSSKRFCAQGTLTQGAPPRNAPPPWPAGGPGRGGGSPAGQIPAPGAPPCAGAPGGKGRDVSS
jgi:hypothetical protein